MDASIRANKSMTLNDKKKEFVSIFVKINEISNTGYSLSLSLFWCARGGVNHPEDSVVGWEMSYNVNSRHTSNFIFNA
jgi:hypothetical protein